MARAHPSEEAFFLGLAKENWKNVTNVERTYVGGITDALEVCFAFDIDTGPPMRFPVPRQRAIMAMISLQAWRWRDGSLDSVWMGPLSPMVSWPVCPELWSV